LNLRQFHFGKINPAAPRVLETFSLPRIPGSEFHPFVLVVLPTRERAVGRLKKESPQSGVMLGWVKPHTPSGGSVWFSAAEKIMLDFSTADRDCLVTSSGSVKVRIPKAIRMW